jgi:hypothetical protein
MLERSPVKSLLSASSAIFNDPDRLQRDFPVPVCQCVQVKTLASTTEGQPERYRLVLSDVSNFVQSMLATRKSAEESWGTALTSF